MHYKVKDEGKVVARAVYNILALSREGRKDLIGMYVSKSEGARFWLHVLTDLKNRGMYSVHRTDLPRDWSHLMRLSNSAGFYQDAFGAHFI